MLVRRLKRDPTIGGFRINRDEIVYHHELFVPTEISCSGE